MNVSDMISKTDCCILAGGKSSRMAGFPKGLLKIGDVTAVERICRSMSCFDRIFLSANNARYDVLELETYADEFKDIGPIAGLYTALSKCSKEKVMVTCCDMPFISPDVVDLLMEKQGYDAVVISDGEHIFPLVGVYDCSKTSELLSRIQYGDFRPYAFLKSLHYKVVDISERYPESLMNINTEEDLRTVRDSSSGYLPDAFSN